MIKAPGYETSGPVLDLSFRRPPLSERSGMPLLVGIGDPERGPLVGLFYDAPSSADQLADPPDLTPAHSHPCDNFRIVMKGELWVGRERYHHGEFRLQRSGRPYGSDGDAPDLEGNWRVIVFCDRRGHRVRPTNPELRSQYASPEAIARTKEHFGDVLPVVLDDADDGVDGLVTTIDKPFSKLGHVDASFEESGQWPELGDGARAAVSLLSDHEVGPVVILQRTPAGRVATPAATFGSDVFRCVVGGWHERDGARVQMGDTRFQAAGTGWEAAVAGPEGLDELIIVGDRRGAVPQVGADAGPWASDLARVLEGLSRGLPRLVAAAAS
ncbi:MAG TPA: hypothetical protein VGL60_10490 [Acidimicrobiales bacterium]|jgi:hypothetical protein